MAVTDIGTLSLVDMTTPDLTIGGIVSQEVSPGIQAAAESSDGEVDARFVSIMSQDFRIGFSSRHLAVCLAGIGISGAEMADLDTYFQKIAKYGTRTGGAANLQIRAATGMIYPVAISARHNDAAIISYMAVPLSTDGSTAPVALNNNVAIPAGGGISEKFTAGGVSINGAAVAVESIDVAFGLQVAVEASDGHVFPTFASIMSRQPIITVRTMDRLALNTLGISGAAQGATDSVVYFRKVAANGTRVADATAEHVKISIDDGLIHCGAINNRHGQRIGTEITILPVYDGTNAILVINAASAIT